MLHVVELTKAGAGPGWDWARVAEVIEAIAAVEDPADFGMVGLRALDSVVAIPVALQPSP